MKTAELKTAKFLLKKVDKEYPSLFRDGKLISPYGADSILRETNPTRVKEEIRFDSAVTVGSVERVIGGLTVGVNRKFCYTEAQCKFAEEVIRTLSKEMDGSENQWERGYNAGLQFAIKTLQRFKNNYPARVEG